MANQQTNQTANQQLKDQLDSYKSRISKSRRRKRIAYIVGLCLVAVAIVGLVVPAATLEFGKTYCGQEEHTHTDACVNRTTVCALPDTSNGNGHVHVPSCYDGKSTLAICGKTPVAHMHLPSCVNAAGTELICGQEETVHMHTLACVDPSTNTFVCGAEELPHVHGVTCYSLQDGNYVLVCKQPSVGHVHTMLCLDPETGEVVCGQEEAVELKHAHSDACYEEEIICGMEEHVHNELCYDEITEAIMKKDEESSAAKEAAEEVEGIDEGVAEGDLTEEEITEAKDQGLLFENDDVIVVFDVPEKYKDDIVLTVTETDDEVEFVEAIEATEEVDADGEPVDDEAAQDGDNGEPVFFSGDGEGDEADEPTDVVDSANKTLVSESVEDEPAYKINLRIEATIDGEPVEDIEALGLTAKLQMKPRVIAPILAEIDYAEVAPELKDEVGAEITVLQQPDNSNVASISEIQAEQVDEVVATSVQEAATSFDVVASVFSARANNTPNPQFTVKYLATEVETPKLSDRGTLTVIDTTGKNMPVNGVTPALTALTLHDGEVEMEVKKDEPIYKSKTFKYYEAPNADYFDTVKKDSYTLVKVRVNTNGEEKEYELEEYDLHFTNREQNAGADKENKSIVYALINETTIITLIYAPTDTTKDFESQFYDYDISNGWIFRINTPWDYTGYNHLYSGDVFSGDTITNQFLDWAKGYNKWDGHIYTYTRQSGINSSGNYSGSGTKLAFGNVNTGTTLGKNTWSNNGKNNELNKYNNASYMGCTFGLVTGLSNGKIQYASGVQAPKLFNEGSATGKATYNDYNLVFDRLGDTYTLNAVAGTGASNLGSFNNPTNSAGKHTDIWTNNFWPMDSAPSYSAGTHDVKFGGTATFKGKAHELRFGPSTEKGTDYTFPESDDGQYHNSYFGMHYEVDFDLDQNYIGPLEYLFFGDDDLWVFLDNQLVVDIGGVHSSVGEYVNLWDYIDKENRTETESHKLSIFYTERGASGSTCYMNFSLPSVRNASPTATDGSIIVSKDVISTEGSSAASNEEFTFSIKLTDKDDKPLKDDYSYTRYDKNGDPVPNTDENGNVIRDENGNPEIGNLIVWDGAEFTLKSGEYIKIEYLPIGTKYMIEEKLEQPYLYRGSYEYIVDGVLEKRDLGSSPGDVPKFEGVVSSEKAEYRVKFHNIVLLQLPATGGEGTYWYWIGGGLLVVLGLLMLWRRQALAAAPSGSSITPTEASVLAFFGDTNFASPSGKPESVHSKGWSRAGKGDESTQKGGRY